jgi:glycolate oxidase FAD binding subunit
LPNVSKMAAPLSSSGADAGLASPGDHLRTIGNPDQWREAGPEDAVAGVQPRMIFEPRNETEVAAVLRIADNAGLSVIPRGGGTKTAWGNPPARADVILSTVRMNQMIEHAWADLTVSVETGCTIATLQNALAQHGQQIAFDPLWPERATIGGILSTNDTGTLRIRYGGLRDLIIGVTIALPDGTLASSGGKVVKNVAGYDLPKLVTGALGTLGVITRAVFRLHPLPRNARAYTFGVQDAAEANRLVLAVQDSKLAHTGLQARFASATSPAVDIRFDGTDAGLASQTETLRKLAAPITETEANATIWRARQELWSDADTATIAKFSVLPGSIAAACDHFRHLGESTGVSWQAVTQGTGLGWLRLETSNADTARKMLEDLRSAFEDLGGSLVVLRRGRGLSGIDTWGKCGDSLPVMLSVKQQFDPRKTLNPGRFVGGI